MARVTITLEQEQLDAYKRIAELQLKPLSSVITDHLTTSDFKPSTAQLYKAAADVHYRYKGFLSRDQAFHITSVALNSLHQSSKPC